jgi:hypothetical protein
MSPPSASTAPPSINSSGGSSSSKHNDKNVCLERGHLLSETTPSLFGGLKRCFVCHTFVTKAVLRCSRCRAPCHRACVDGASGGTDDDNNSLSETEAAGLELFKHITNGDVDAVRAMPDLKLLVGRRFSDDQVTPLIKCVTTYSTKPQDSVVRIFEVLLSAADPIALNMPDAPSHDRAPWTPLMWSLASSFASPRLVDELLAQPRIDVKRALAVLCGSYHRADFKKYFEKMVKVLGADVNEPASHGNTPLHKACQNRSIGAVLVRALLAHDADIERTNERGQTALFEAVVRDQEEIVRTLLGAGANVRVRDNSNQYAAGYAVTPAVRQLLAEAEERVNKLTEWLRSLQLEVHVEKFLMHKIYLDVAPLLTDDALMQMGVKKVGDRLRIMSSVKELVQQPISIDQPPAEIDGGGHRRARGGVAALAPTTPRSGRHSRRRKGSNSGGKKKSASDDEDGEVDDELEAAAAATTQKGARRGGDSAAPATPAAAAAASSDSDLDYEDDPAHRLENQAAVSAAAAAAVRGVGKRSGSNTAIPNNLHGVVEYRKIHFYEELGRGTFGTVYRGALDGKPVAIKIIEPRQAEHHAQFVQQLCKQYEMWSTLTDRHIVKLIGVCFEPQLALITEVCKRGNLLSVLRQASLNVHWQMALTWAMQICAAVFYLLSNEPPIFHRDLKPANVLVTQSWRLKLCDFDTARYAVTQSDVAVSAGGQLVGSPAYMAPELFTVVHYSEKCDVYSMAVMLNELFSRCVDGEHSAPYNDRTLPGVQYAALIVAAQKQERPLISTRMPEPVVDVIRAGWAQNPQERPTCEDLLERIGALAQQYMREREAWDAARNMSKVI